MKKFLVFLVAIVVVVCIGLTTYYFLRNDEAIDFKTKQIYCNVGDVITLDDLGYTVFKEHRNTTYDFNAGGDEVTEYIYYNADNGYYIANKGGIVNLVITTSNSNYPEFTINVHIGDGSEENPYFIDSQADLQKIGDTYSLSSNYVLRANITLTNEFIPIGYVLNAETDIEVDSGFSGTFDGDGYTISGLNIINTNNYTNAGLFTQLNSGASVTDLNLRDITISGEYQTAGALAGMANNATIARVQATNVNISNNMSNSKTGALIGSLAGANSSLTISSAQGSLLIGNTEGSTISASVGGLIGEVDKATVQATYADTEITANNVNGDVGGFVGKFIISTNNGTIRESYSVSTSEYANFGAFIGTIEQDNTDFVLENANQLRHLIGNYVYTNGKASVNSYDDTFFTRGFYVELDGLYFIVGFENLSQMMTNSEYVFYAIDGDKTLWDTSAWNITGTNLPTLKMTNATLSSISNAYFMVDVEEETIGSPENSPEQNAAAFLALIENDQIVNKKYRLGGDINLSGTWTPVELINSIIDGNGFKITGLNLTTNDNGNVGLFSVIDNSTITDLTLENVVINLSNDATNIGALAGQVISTSIDSVSTIDNVKVTYSSATVRGTNFGGLVAILDDNSIVTNSSVESLILSNNTYVNNVGGLIARIVEGSLNNSSTLGITIYGTQNVGGAVAENNGTIENITGNAVVRYSSNNSNSYVAGIAAINNRVVSNSSYDVEIVIDAANNGLRVGGVSAFNNGNISNITLTGNGITINQSVTASEIYVGGIVADNNAEITNAYNLMNSIGSYFEGRNYYVGGIVANNNGTITQSIAGSDIYGNYVSGVVVNMTNANASVSQVLVGEFNPDTRAISENYITGDKFVAGISYNFTHGTMTDIQAVSNLEGRINDTKTSLVVLIFPNTATLRNATINSSLSGSGDFYRETWKDYTTSGTADNYNIYASTSASGRMESVVINIDRARQNGISDIISAEIRESQWNNSYAQSNNNNNVKEVNSDEFSNWTSFTGTHTLTARVWYVFVPITREYVRELTFNFGIWTQDNGIRLTFLANV